MKYALLTLLGLALGLFMVLLLPAILGTYLADWWLTRTGTPHVCAGGEDADPSPTEEQPDHAQNPEHPFFLEWQRAEEERRIDQWIRRAMGGEEK
jgi:hypothetical protein